MFPRCTPGLREHPTTDEDTKTGMVAGVKGQLYMYLESFRYIMCGSYLVTMAGVKGQLYMYRFIMWESYSMLSMM